MLSTECCDTMFTFGTWLSWSTSAPPLAMSLSFQAMDEDSLHQAMTSGDAHLVSCLMPVKFDLMGPPGAQRNCRETRKAFTQPVLR